MSMAPGSDRPPELQRRFETPRYLDPALDPPEYKDFSFPTVTSQYRGPIRRGDVRAPRGSIQGSIYMSGSHYPSAPGTYSLRITRRAVSSGSRNQRWMIRHSRTGTADIIDFTNPGRYEAIGDQMAPVYVFGPGTVVYGFIGANASGSMGSAYFTSQFLEGYRNA